MAEVKWQARRVSDSVLVDVTADIDGVPLGAPTPNAIEAGGAGGVAAFVEPTTATPEAIVDALIAAGLMEAS